MSKYKILKELINDRMEREVENMQEANKSVGTNSPGFSMALGAHNEYKQVLTDIEELETEGRFLA